MKKLIYIVIAGCMISGALGWAAEWTTDGGDAQRTGWQKNEKILNKDNVKNLKLLWKLKTDNVTRALFSFTPALILDNVKSNGTAREMVYFVGASDNLYAVDANTGQMVWHKHFSYETVPGRGGNNANTDPAHLGFLGPGGSTDTPVIGPPDAQGRRPIYVIDGGGMVHSLDTANGEDLKPPFHFGNSKFALQLVDNTLWAPIGGGMAATKLDDPEHHVYMTQGMGRSGGLWGLRGAAVDSSGTIWSTTGDGNVDTRDPNNLIIANSMVGFQIEGDHVKVKNYFTPPNWYWLWKRDLDPNNTATIFNYKGRELLVASGKECRVFLLDPKNPGGADHHTPLYKTPLFCNEDVDFQDEGSWGALSTWEDANGTRWVLAPFWGPVHSQFKFPTVNTPVAKEGGIAAFKVQDTNGKLELVPVWVSRDMHRGYPPIIANGVVYAYGSGEETKQAFPDIGLNFDSTIRASKSGHVTLFALDAETGKELWSSGDTITSFNHFNGLSLANGKLYLGTYDGTFWAFGLGK
ncbi:MAG TPA: PQQ-binding-like beta-propeller repeat protein [Bryobacteraceae bacterium]|nr:PQQ-binding-like beta-propeller repeat protein [Bryobacteraceae bacterium]